MLEYLEFSCGIPEINPELSAVAFIYLQAIRKLNCIKQTQLKIYIRKQPNDKFSTTPLHLSKHILIVYYKYDLTDYCQLNRKEKIQLQADVMHDSLYNLFNLLKLDFTPLQSIRDSIVDAGLCVDVELQLKRNKESESHKVRVIVRPDFDVFSYYLIVSNELITTEFLLFEGHTAYIFYYKNLFHSILSTKDFVAVRSKSKRVIFECKPTTSEIVSIKYGEPAVEEAVMKYRKSVTYDFSSYLNYGL